MKRSSSYGLLVCGCLMTCIAAWRCNVQTDIYGIATNLPFVDNSDGSGKRVEPVTDNSDPDADIDEARITITHVAIHRVGTDEANNGNEDGSTGDHDGP